MKVKVNTAMSVLELLPEITISVSLNEECHSISIKNILSGISYRYKKSPIRSDPMRVGNLQKKMLQQRASNR